MQKAVLMGCGGAFRNKAGRVSRVGFAGVGEEYAPARLEGHGGEAPHVCIGSLVEKGAGRAVPQDVWSFAMLVYRGVLASISGRSWGKPCRGGWTGIANDPEAGGVVPGRLSRRRSKNDTLSEE